MSGIPGTVDDELFESDEAREAREEQEEQDRLAAEAAKNADPNAALLEAISSLGTTISGMAAEIETLKKGAVPNEEEDGRRKLSYDPNEIMQAAAQEATRVHDLLDQVSEDLLTEYPDLPAEERTAIKKQLRGLTADQLTQALDLDEPLHKQLADKAYGKLVRAGKIKPGERKKPTSDDPLTATGVGGQGAAPRNEAAADASEAKTLEGLFGVKPKKRDIAFSKSIGG